MKRGVCGGQVFSVPYLTSTLDPAGNRLLLADLYGVIQRLSQTSVLKIMRAPA